MRTQDTKLALESLHLKTIPIGKAGEESTENTGQKGLQTKQWPRSKRKGIRKTDDGEIVQEENQTENKGKDWEWENENPVRAFCKGTGEHFSSRILDRPRTKEKGMQVTGNARGSQNTALPFSAWIGCALERFRIHFSRVSMGAAGKQTQAMKMASCLCFLPLETLL